MGKNDEVSVSKETIFAMQREIDDLRRAVLEYSQRDKPIMLNNMDVLRDELNVMKAKLGWLYDIHKRAN